LKSIYIAKNNLSTLPREMWNLTNFESLQMGLNEELSPLDTFYFEKYSDNDNTKWNIRIIWNKFTKKVEITFDN